MANRIQLRRDTAANWTSANPVLAQDEAGVDTTAGKMKIGDGSTSWTSLGYVVGAAVLTGAGAPSNGAGSNGDLYLNSSNGDYYVKSAGSWGSPAGNLKGATGATGAAGAAGAAGVVDLAYLKQNPYHIDDFDHYNATYPQWVITVAVSGALTADYDNARLNGHTGIVDLNCGVSATAKVGFWTPQRQMVFDSAVGTWTYETQLKLGATPVVGDDYTLLCGFADYIQIASVSYGAFFFIDRTVSTTNWLTVTRSAITPTQTVTDSGVAFSTNWVTLKVVHNASNNVLFYINGSLVATHTTNVPSNTQRVNIAQGLENISATVAHRNYFDYVFWQNNLITSR